MDFTWVLKFILINGMRNTHKADPRKRAPWCMNVENKADCLTIASKKIVKKYGKISSLRCCSSVTKSRLTLGSPMDCSMPGFPALHYLLEFAWTHVHWVGDVIQASHFLLLPSPPSLNCSQHQGLFQWVGSLHQVARVLELQLQHQPFHCIFIQVWFPFRLTGLVSFLSKGGSSIFSSTAVRKHQFFGAQSSLWSNSHICTRLLEKPGFWPYRPLSAKWCLCFLIGFLVASKKWAIRGDYFYVFILSEN